MSIFKFKSKQTIPVFLSVIMLCSCSITENPNSQKPQTTEMFLFDTYVSVTSYNYDGNGIDGYGIDGGTKELLSTLSEEFSETYSKKANELSGENYPNILECANVCREWGGRFGGMFDNSINFTCGALTGLWGISGEHPHVPDANELAAALETITDEHTPFSLMPDGTMLDFGASAKGFACDKVKEQLDSTNFSCQIVSLGSSTLLYGSKPDGSKFRAAVKNPNSPSAYLGTIATDAAFISTSGGYERYFEENGVKYEHILSPETGMPVATDLCSVTVIAPAETKNGGAYTDLLATAIYSGGTSALREFMALNTEYGFVAVDKNNNVYVSAGVDFTLYEGSDFVLSENL